MANLGFIKLPRALLQDPIWKDLPATYRIIFITILENMCFSECRQDDHGQIINLKPGQLLTTERKLVELCNCKDIDKSLIHRSLNKFLMLGFSNQQTIHTKTVITVTHPAVCELLNNDAEPRFEPTSNQLRTNFEPEKKKDKKDKKEKKEYSSDSIEYGLAKFLFDHLRKFLPDFKEPDFQKWAKDIETLIRKDKRSPEDIKNHILWLEREAGFWRKTILSPSGLANNWDKISASKQENTNASPSMSNKQFACELFENYTSQYYEIEINGKEVTFIPLIGQQMPFGILYNDIRFKEKIEDIYSKAFILSA